MSKVSRSRRQLVTRGAALLGAGAAYGFSARGVAQPASSEPAPNASFEALYDVVVVGSGAAGTVAALYAHEAGARVLIVEKASVPGGTSAKSGGNFWIPNNAGLRARQLQDPREDFLRYVARATFPASYDAEHTTFGAPEPTYRLWETFYDNASAMVEGLDRMGAIKSRVTSFGGAPLPDYYGELKENRQPYYRCMEAVPRYSDGPSAGDEFMSQLVAAVSHRGIELATNARATQLIQDAGGGVIGLEVETRDGPRRIGARRGVVFASGGFAHNKELLLRYHANPIFGGCASPSSTGDLVTIAGRVGAQFGNMAGAWRAPVVLDETARYVATPVDVFGLAADSMLIVNRYGTRCHNECRPYHDRAKSMYRWDPIKAEFPDLYHIVIYDQRAAEVSAGMMPIPPTPTGIDYVMKGDSLEELAQKIDERFVSLSRVARRVRLDADFVSRLKASIARFNEFAASGVDKDFARGEGLFDKFAAPPPARPPWPKNDNPNPSMYPIAEQGPYYAFIIAPGVLDTSGGPVIDEKARILNNRDEPIEGLFGAGNCIASPSGDSYWSGGCTLALAMTFGMIAGRTAAASRSRDLP